MANFDDIFNSQPKEETEGQSFASFDKDEWAAQKKQERENAFALIDETAQHMTNDGELFQSYLDVQAHFDRYSVGNAILITAQKPDATQLADFKGWKDYGVYIKKGESGIVLLEPGEEYTKDDGSIGVSYNSKKVFDITQTNAKPRENAGIKRDERMLLKALIHNAPCPIEISQQMPEGINAAYRPQDKKIFVRAGLDAGDIFRGLSQELAHAHLDNGEYKRNEHAFTAYCASYMLCSRYNVAKDMFRFERLPENISTMDARSMRNELSKIRDVANEISADMAKILEKVLRRDDGLGSGRQQRPLLLHRHERGQVRGRRGHLHAGGAAQHRQDRERPQGRLLNQRPQGDQGTRTPLRQARMQAAQEPLHGGRRADSHGLRPRGSRA